MRYRPKVGPGGRIVRARTHDEVEAEIRAIERNAERMEEPTAYQSTQDIAQAMRWAIGEIDVPVSDRLLPGVPFKP